MLWDGHATSEDPMIVPTVRTCRRAPALFLAGLIAALMQVLSGAVLVASSGLPVSSVCLADAPVPAQPVATPARPATDTYHGETVTDNYRWLENWEDPEVQAWSEAQNARARAFLDAIPGRAEVARRMTELLSFESASYSSLVERGGRLFAEEHRPPREQPVLVVLSSADDPGSARTVLDPVALDSTGGTSMDWFSPSPDGKRVAVSLSQGGSEDGSVRVFDAESGRELPGGPVPRANSGTAGGSLAWAADGGSFWYTRHPAANEVKDTDLGFFQVIYRHVVGTPAAEDTPSLAEGLPRTAESFLESTDDGRAVSDLVQLGDGGNYELYLLDAPTGTWARVARYDDGVTAVRFSPDGALWILERGEQGRGRILRLAAGATGLDSATVVVPEGAAIISGFEVTRDRLWVVEQAGGPSRLRRYDLAGSDLGEAPIPPVSSVYGLTRTEAGSILFHVEGYTRPGGWQRASADGSVRPTALQETSPASLDAVRVVRLEAISKDGTRVPMTVLIPPGVREDGTTPALLTGYGGFGLSVAPGFSRDRIAWLEQGCIWAEANLRGGAEFGEAWHLAGNLTRKQNVFDDFIACAEKLVAEGYTNPGRLAIQGGSNGGLLVGAALTQRPDLFRAVVAEVGYYDMLRYETRPNGQFNSTEYGTVQTADEFRALRAYSPYHAVREGVRYPPTLFLTGANDPRVDPMHSRKMVARLQAVGSEAWLRTSGSTGHGIGTPLSERIAESVDVHAFLDVMLMVHEGPGRR
jgi:prolyl oligopeptidase